MKKYLMLFLCLILMAGITNARGKKMTAGVNAVVSLPMGDFGDVVNTGFGATGTFAYRVAKQIDLTGTIGYIRYGYDNENVDGGISNIPLLFGGRYYFMPGKVQPYGTAELGMHFTSGSDIEITIPGFGTRTVEGDSSTNFGFGFGGGVLVALNKKTNFDGTLQLNIIDGELNITFEAGASFALN